MEEQMKDIKDYEGLYQVSNLGTVYSVKSGKFLKPRKTKLGYILIDLYKNNKQKTYYLHRLVAQAFIPNPLNLPEVNHKSEIKTDNRVENLEWMSHKENINYGSRTERCSKKVLQFTREGEFVAEYSSTHEAERQTGIYFQSISQCCKGKRHSAGNYIWRYKKEEAT
jgi:hypothetical protein